MPFHPKTQELLARLKAKKEQEALPKPIGDCVACGNTGKNSRGGLCDPCVNNGRIKCVRS